MNLCCMSDTFHPLVFIVDLTFSVMFMHNILTKLYNVFCDADRNFPPLSTYC